MIAPEITVVMHEWSGALGWNKWEKNKEKMKKKKDTLETYLIWQKPIYCDTPLSRLARRIFEYSLAPLLKPQAKPRRNHRSQMCKHWAFTSFPVAQVDLGYCNTVWYIICKGAAAAVYSSMLLGCVNYFFFYDVFIFKNQYWFEECGKDSIHGSHRYRKASCYNSGFIKFL